MSTKELACWFWHTILEKENNPWEDLVHFRRYLGEAKRVTKEYNADVKTLKQALLDMKQHGIDVKSMHLPITWTKHGTNSMTWYESAEHYLSTPPPIYDRHAFKKWCEVTGNEHYLDNME